MKILLTGLPRSGKSTMMATVIANVNPKRGLFSPELREKGERIGFDLRNERGEAAVLSRVGLATDYPVGRYYVDLASFNGFIEPLFKYTKDDLLFIDEISQMQLYSKSFIDLASNYAHAPNDFIGTISQVYEDPFINNMKQDKNMLLCVVEPENRDELMIGVIEMLSSRGMFDVLSADRQQKVLSMARDYLAKDRYVSLKKLFKNAVPYLFNNRIHKSADRFTVNGHTDEHYVSISRNDFTCDCDLFNGRGKFVDIAGECSHIQSVKLFLV